MDKSDGTLILALVAVILQAVQVWQNRHKDGD